MSLFKKKDPKDMVREWQSKMRSEMRGVDSRSRCASFPRGFRVPLAPRDARLRATC